MHYECDLRRKLAPKVLKHAKRLLPIGAKTVSLGSKWGIVDVTIKDYSIDADGDVNVTIQPIHRYAKQTGKLFELIDCTDF